MSVIGVLLLSAVVTTGQVFASLFEPVSDRQLVCEATDIVRGRIGAVQASWDDDHVAIWTTATLQVDEVVRGTLSPGASVPLKEVGGTADGYAIQAEGFPTFREGEEVVVLLRPWEEVSGAYRVWGYGRGMFVVDRVAGGAPSTRRHDVLESGHATMHTDRIPPAIVLDDLQRELRSLARRCESRAP